MKALFQNEKDAIIINTARAKLIDRQALYDALHNGQLYGYEVMCIIDGLMRLIACENTVLTPHIAASSEERQSHVGYRG